MDIAPLRSIYDEARVAASALSVNGGSVAGIRVLVFWVVLSLTTLGCSPVGDYQGDGEISAVAWFPRHAVQIDFPAFSLDQPLSVTYSLKNLPRLHYNYIVGLTVVDADLPSDHWPPPILTSLDGKIAFHLMDSQRQVIREINGPVGDLFWPNTMYGPPFGFLSVEGNEEMSVFHYSDLAAPREFAFLRVQFTPGNHGAGVHARVRIISDWY